MKRKKPLQQIVITGGPFVIGRTLPNGALQLHETEYDTEQLALEAIATLPPGYDYVVRDIRGLAGTIVAVAVRPSPLH